MHRAVRALLDVLLPPQCRVCKQDTCGLAVPWVCQPCWQAMPYITAPTCAQCGCPFAAPPEGIASPRHRCGACLLHPPAYARARAVGHYTGVLRTLIHAMKYEGVYGLVQPLGTLLCDQFARHWPTERPQALIPVPLHRSRLRGREFDQALALARCLSASVGIPVWADVLIRHHKTRSQVGLNVRERRANIRGAFTVRRPQACAGQTLLLIDDVYTTGATVQECTRQLYRHGAARVEVYTLARVG